MKWKVILTLAYAVVIIFGIIHYIFFPYWTFTEGGYVIAFRLIQRFSWLGFLFCLPMLFNARKWILIPWGIILSIFLIISAYGEIKPIDTTTEPKDIEVYKTFSDGKKLVIREYENEKTGSVIHDTVLVKDCLIFRRICNSLILRQ